MKAKSKPYDVPETEPNIAAEPATEYGMDINILKLKTIERVMGMTSKENVKKMLAFAGELKEQQRPPCQFTLEELKEQLRISEEDFENGRYITSEELAKQIETWK